MSARRFRPDGEDVPLLLNPGPSNVSEAVARALLRGDACHREPEYLDVQRELRAALVEAFAPGPADYAPVLLTGSGTAALEAALASLAPPGRTALVLRNGVYGERMDAIAHAHRIDVATLDRDWVTPHDPEALRRALAERPEVGLVACVHHETTTGLLNPIRALAEVCREAGVPILVDAISSLGGEELDLVGWGIDAAACTANKCIRGVAGMSFVLARRTLLDAARAYPPRSLYLHLPTYLEQQDAGGTPFTPAVQVAYAFLEAMRELLAEGVAARVGHMGLLSTHLRAGFTRLGLVPMLEPEVLSRTLTALRLPAGWTYEALHAALRAEGFVIYAGQGPLRAQAFRIANMGVMDVADAERLLAALGRILAGEGAA